MREKYPESCYYSVKVDNPGAMRPAPMPTYEVTTDFTWKRVLNEDKAFTRDVVEAIAELVRAVRVGNANNRTALSNVEEFLSYYGEKFNE